MSDGFGETAILNELPEVNADLSAQIERAVLRDPLDRVRCVRVFENYYRCNWWAEPSTNVSNPHVSEWGAAATQCVRKSQFLKVIIVDGQLVINEMRPPGM